MNQEALVSNLRERIGTDANISDRTLNEFVPTIISQFEDDSKITDDSYTPYVTLLKSLGGQIRHDVSDGITNFKNGDEFKGMMAKNIADFKEGDEYKTLVEAAIEKAKKEWEQKNGNGNGNENGNENGNGNGNENGNVDVSKLVADAVAQAMAGLTGEDGAIGKLQKSVTDFTSSYQAQQVARQQEQTKAQLKAYLESRKADKPAAVNLAIERLDLSKGMDMATLEKQVEANYEKVYKEFFGEGSKPYGGQGQGNGGNADADLKSRLEQMKRTAETQANQAETLRKSFV